MKVNFKPIYLGIAGAMLASPALWAADPAQDKAIGFGVTLATDSLKKVSHNSTGFNLNGSLEFNLPLTDIKIRPGLGLSVFPGKKGDNWNYELERNVSTKTQLINIQASFDLVIPTRVCQSLNLITGLSLNQWRYSGQTYNNDPHPFRMEGSKASDDLKLGLRVGLNYKFNNKWSGEALLQMVEYGYPTTEVTSYNINPCWVQFGVKYHF
jgi:hypothetical protein